MAASLLDAVATWDLLPTLVAMLEHELDSIRDRIYQIIYVVALEVPQGHIPMLVEVAQQLEARTDASARATATDIRSLLDGA